MIIVAIDPSINTIGSAIWIDGEIETRCIRTLQGGKAHLVKTLPIYLLWITEKLKGERADCLVVEYPNFQASTRGKIAAQQGYTLDLAFVAGFVAQQIPARVTFFPTPMKWKGQTPKDVVGRRFTEWTGVDYHTLTDHEFEAVMMIHWALKQPDLRR